MEDLKRENKVAQEKFDEAKAKGFSEDRLICKSCHYLLIIILNYHFSDDPCTKIHCQAGRVCQVKDTTAECVCIPECPVEFDPRRKVCTNRNETWASDCEVHQHRCFCDQRDARCTNQKNSHMHIDYYGECKQIQVRGNSCTYAKGSISHKLFSFNFEGLKFIDFIILQNCDAEEMLDFPRRMREWLFHVMKELADRQELDVKLAARISHVETELNTKWTRAAIWK